MPLEPYQRGKTWWVKGRVEYNGAPIGDYKRESTGSSKEAGAREYITELTNRTIRTYLLGPEAVVTFADAVAMQIPKQYDATCLLKIIPELGHEPLIQIYPDMVKALGPKLYPKASTDTWKRKVISPVSAVINRAHQAGLCAPIKITNYTANERIAQDKARGKQSRKPKKAGSWDWLDAFQAHAHPHLGALAEFMFETGCRISQAVELTPEDLDLPNARVRLEGQKSHDAQWVAISTEMVATLSNLAMVKPMSKDHADKLKIRVFGYLDRGGMRKAWASAEKAAEIEHLSPHEAGRHGFYTELTQRQGVNELVAAKAGRWSGADLPRRVYAEVSDDERAMRDRIRKGRLINPIAQARRKSGS